MRAFAGGFYKCLISLYQALGVSVRRQDFLYAFSTSLGTYHLHPSNFHRLPPRPPGSNLFSHVLSLVLLYVVYAYFTMCAFLVAPRDCETLADYLSRIWLPRWVVGLYLLPLFTSVSTCSHEELMGFPAMDVVKYRKAVFMQDHYVVDDGVSTVRAKLLRGIPITFHRTVHSVEALPSSSSSAEGGIRITWDGGTEAFDRAVLAVNPHIVGKLYRRLGHDMSRIGCTDVQVVVHNDPTTVQTLFPHTPLTKLSSRAHALSHGKTIIHLLSAAGRTSATEIHAQALVTTNPAVPVSASDTIATSSFTRVLRSVTSRRIVNDIVDSRGSGASDGWRNGDEGVFVVGAWCWDGMVLLEGCVVSAARVARDGFGICAPWSVDLV